MLEAFNSFMCFLHKGTQATGWRGVRRRKRHLQGAAGARLPRAKSGGGSRRPNKPGRHSLRGSGGGEGGGLQGAPPAPADSKGQLAGRDQPLEHHKGHRGAGLVTLKDQGQETGWWRELGGQCQRWLLVSSPKTTFLLFWSHPRRPFLSC